MREAYSLESKKLRFCFFVKNSKMTHFGPNWTKFDPNLRIFVVKKFKFFPFFFYKNLQKIMSLWVWKGSHASDPTWRLVFFLFYKSEKKKLFHAKNPLFTFFYPLYDLQKIFEMPNTEVFHFFSKTVHWNFLIFCTKSSVCSWKKWGFRFFVENSKMTHFGPNWAKFDPNLGIFVVKNL